jgi:broad specificity phosphatase PhoE
MPSQIVLYLIRHGQTALNAQGQLRGWLDPPLDDVGMAQARSLGEALSESDLLCVASSPLRRAQQTAAAVAAPHGKTVQVVAELIDRNFGPWSGAPAEAVRQRYESLRDVPGDEPWEAFSRRVVGALFSAVERFDPGPLAVVAHDAVNQVVLSELVPTLGEPLSISQRTGCFNRLEYAEGRWDVTALNILPADDRSA